MENQLLRDGDCNMANVLCVFLQGLSVSVKFYIYC